MRHARFASAIFFGTCQGEMTEGRTTTDIQFYHLGSDILLYVLHFLFSSPDDERECDFAAVRRTSKEWKDAAEAIFKFKRLPGQTAGASVEAFEMGRLAASFYYPRTEVCVSILSRYFMR